jgi:hypothetical protein
MARDFRWKHGEKPQQKGPELVHYCRKCKTSGGTPVCMGCGEKTVLSLVIRRGGEVAAIVPFRTIPHFDRPMKRVDGEYVVREA